MKTSFPQNTRWFLFVPIAAIALMLSPNGRTQAGAGLNAARQSGGPVLNIGRIPAGAVVMSSSLKVALLATDEAPWISDVQAKLQATGRFSQVDIIDISSTTPSVAQMQAYDAVLVWTDGGFADFTTFGNNLADYVDGGGGVVIAVFANASIPLGGRFASDDYYGIEPASQTQGTELTLGTVYNPSSPLMAGVSSFDGGSSSYRSTGSPHANTLRVADWSNGDPLIVTRVINGTPRVDLNFFPPSSDQRSDFWHSSTDGATLMANALEFVHARCTPAPAGISHWWPGDGDANDLVGHNDGTLQGGATFGFGEVRQAFTFGPSETQYVDVGLINLSPTALTFTAWINLATADNVTIFSNSDRFTGNGLWIGAANGFPGAFVGNGTFLDADCQQQIAFNTWQHIALVWNGSSLTFYINGSAAQTNPGGSASSIGSSNTPATIGKGVSRGFSGQIDEVQVFDRVLSADEIAEIANARHAGVCHSCVSAPASLLGWWKGEGDATDSQNSNDGIFNGTPAFAAGEVGQAFRFDGSNYVSAGNPSNLNITGAQVTIDAWINPSVALSSEAWFFGKSADGGALRYAIEWESGFLVGRANTSGVEAAFTPPTNTWTHVAVVYDGNANPTTTLYVNGAVLASGSPSSGNLTASDAPFVIGAFGGGGRNFTGLVDEVEVFDRALSQREVQRIYDAFDGGKCPCVEAPAGMIAWWAGNDNAFDIQGAHDATLNGVGFAAGEVNHAFKFNGTSDNVSIPASNDWNFGTGGFTFDFWARATGTGRMYTLDFGPVGGVRNLDFDFNDDPFGLWVYWNSNGGANGANAIKVGSRGAYTDSQWHHFALTRSGSTWTLYIDGAVAGTASDAESLNLSGGSDNYLGSFVAQSDFWNGSIDEVEVFNRALSADEVAGIYHAGGAGKCRPYYTVAVSSDGGGTVTGGATVRQGTPVEVSATPDACYAFAGWFENNQLVSSANPYDFVVKGANRTLVAKFNKIQYQISASASPTAGGTVSGAGPYDCGAQASLTATPNSGYQFVNWTENGNQVSTSATYTFTVSGNRTLVANFKLTQTTHLGTANGSGTIFTHNNQASFSFNISNKKGTPSGTLSYTDTKGGIKLTSTAITQITLNGNQANFSGKGTIPSSNPRKPTPVSFSVVAVDNGMPGTPKDTFQIQISTPYFASGNLTSGNITVN